MDLQALIDRRNALWEQNKELLELTESEDRAFTADENEQWDKRDADIEALDSRIQRIESEHRRKERDETILPPSNVPDEKPVNKDEGREQVQADRENRAVQNWGRGVTTVEDREVLGDRLSPDGRELTLDLRTTRELRAQSTTAAAGGYTIAQELASSIEAAMLAFGGMRQANTTVIRTGTGGQLDFPTNDDTSNTGAILAENAAASEQDLTFGTLQLDAYKYTSKLVRVSLELLQDSAFDFASFLGEALGTRIGRITNTHFTTGTGTSQPNGVVTAGTLGKTGATGQTTTVTYNDLVDLLHSVDPSYRSRGAQWMFSDATFAAIKKLVDGNSLPLWQPSLSQGAPNTILGHGYVINQDVADMAANAKSILFGDFSKYLIRDVLTITVRRSDDRYMEYAQSAFIAFSRHDGDLLDAGTNPVKYYANSAT